MTKPSCSAIGSRMASNVRSHSRLACTTARVRRSIFASSAALAARISLWASFRRAVFSAPASAVATCEPQPAKRWRSASLKAARPGRRTASSTPTSSPARIRGMASIAPGSAPSRRRVASRQLSGSSPSPRLTGTASAAQAPASSSPMGIDIGGAGRGGSAAPSVSVASSPMRQQITRSAGTSPRTRRTASQAICSGLRSRCRAWTSFENRSASASRRSRVEATWAGGVSVPRRSSSARATSSARDDRHDASGQRPRDGPVGDVKDGACSGGDDPGEQQSPARDGRRHHRVGDRRGQEAEDLVRRARPGLETDPAKSLEQRRCGRGGADDQDRQGRGHRRDRQPTSATAARSSESSRRMEPVESRTM